MDVGTIFWVIVGIIFLVVRVLKSAHDQAGRQRPAGGDEGAYEARPEEIQEFLRSLSVAAQRKAGATAPGAGARPAVDQVPQTPFWEAAPTAQAAPAAPPVEELRSEARPTAQPSFWEPMPTAQPPSAPQTEPEARPAPKQRRRKAAPVRKSPPAEVLAARPPAAVAPKEPRRGGASVFARQGTDLKRAVFWAEVLGPPVSLRHARRLPLGPQH